jgi:hypothetical protein
MACLAMVAVVSSCGGGGGGGSSASSSGGSAGATTEFPLDRAYKAMLVSGVTKNWAVSGSKCGTAAETDGPSGAATGTYGGNAASASYSESLSTHLNDCASGSFVNSTSADVLYLGDTPESNYWKVGTTIAATNYGEFPTAYQAPVVYVGLSGSLGTENWFLGTTNSGTADGHTYFHFAVAADGASSSTAIVDLYSERYDAMSPTAQLLYTEHRYYRIAATGPLVPTKIDIQYSAASGSTDHLIFQ